LKDVSTFVINILKLLVMKTSMKLIPCLIVVFLLSSGLELTESILLKGGEGEVGGFER